MRLTGGPQDGLELTQDMAGIWCEVPMIVKNGAEHCYTYRTFPSGNIFYEPTANRNNLWFQGASFQTARYSLLTGQWIETKCACGEIVATRGEDPPGPPQAHPPAP